MTFEGATQMMAYEHPVELACEHRSQITEFGGGSVVWVLVALDYSEINNSFTYVSDVLDLKIRIPVRHRLMSEYRYRGWRWLRDTL